MDFLRWASCVDGTDEYCIKVLLQKARITTLKGFTGRSPCIEGAAEFTSQSLYQVGDEIVPHTQRRGWRLSIQSPRYPRLPVHCENSGIPHASSVMGLTRTDKIHYMRCLRCSTASSTQPETQSQAYASVFLLCTRQ